MKNTKNLLLAIGITVFGFGISAHEGEDHDAPSMVQAPKGGTIKSLEQTHVEVLVKGKDIKIYLYDKELKPQSVNGYVVSAKVQMPRSKKSEAIVLTARDQSFEASFDAKGMHRYTLHLAVKDPKTGHDDKLKYNIEPKK